MGEDYFVKYRKRTFHTFGHENHGWRARGKDGKNRESSFQNDIKFQCKRYFCAKSNLS